MLFITRDMIEYLRTLSTYKQQEKREFICENCGIKTNMCIKSIITHDNLLCFNCRMKEIKANRTQEEILKANENYKKTCIKKYGYESPLLKEESRINLCKSLKKEKTVEKRKNTNLKKYGVDNPLKSKEIREKIENTNLKKYGSISPAGSDIIREKIENTNLEKYGARNILCSEYGKNKVKTTNLKKYGVEYPLMSEEIRKKVQKTNLEKYGSISPFGSEEIREKIRNDSDRSFTKKYFYNNVYFDSSWELAYYIWLIDNNINFIYHPETNLSYLGSDNKIHKYFSDFLLLENNQYIEIKGNLFFNKKGEPFHNGTKSFWWDKYNALIDAGVKILKIDDLRDIFKYIKENYGNNYLKQFKRQNSIN